MSASYAGLLLCLALTFALHVEGRLAEKKSLWAFDEDEADLKALLGILHKPRQLERHKYKNDPLKLRAFKWDSCAAAGAPIQPKTITLGPDPVKIPGDISASFSSKLLKNITSPLTAQLTLQKKIFGVFVTIPCIDNVGSCTYDNVCSLIPIKPGQPCPEPLAKYKIPCTCPFAQGTYTLPKTTVNVNPPSIPSFLESGDYKVKAEVKTGSTVLGCIDIQLSLA